jgi:hypothetical protein
MIPKITFPCGTSIKKRLAFFSNFVGDKPINDIHVIRFAEIACFLYVKGLIDNDADDCDCDEDVKHHTPALG